MTDEQISDVYRRITSVTTKYTFTWPVDQADCATVRAELAAAVPEGIVGVNLASPRGDYVAVVVSIAGKRIYQRAMIVRKDYNQGEVDVEVEVAAAVQGTTTGQAGVQGVSGVRAGTARSDGR